MQDQAYAGAWVSLVAPVALVVALIALTSLAASFSELRNRCRRLGQYCQSQQIRLEKLEAGYAAVGKNAGKLLADFETWSAKLLASHTDDTNKATELLREQAGISAKADQVLHDRINAQAETITTLRQAIDELIATASTVSKTIRVMIDTGNLRDSQLKQLQQSVDELCDAPKTDGKEILQAAAFALLAEASGEKRNYATVVPNVRHPVSVHLPSDVLIQPTGEPDKLQLGHAHLTAAQVKDVISTLSAWVCTNTLPAIGVSHEGGTTEVQALPEPVARY